MKGPFKKILWTLAGLGVFLMSFSLRVQHFDTNHLLVDFSNFDPAEIPENWVDYFLTELAETGEELPGKNLQPRLAKAELRKQVDDFFSGKLNLTVQRAFVQPALDPDSPGSRYQFVPQPGYYASLSLLYVF